jgi:DNA-directed RNA polymerase specialized sigma24 family protein
MAKDLEITAEAFDLFLRWLDPDPETAANKYEDIRRHLIILMNRWGCTESEHLADITIDRVVRRAQEMAATYQGDPAPYFITVARNLVKEWLPLHQRQSAIPDDLPHPPEGDPEDEREYQCLDRCIQALPARDRDMVVRYYEQSKQAKIDHRKLLASELGIGLNALRIKAHRARAALRQCIDECLAET